MDLFYQMFDNSYIQRQAKQVHEEQVENVQKSLHKLHDFLNSLDDIKPEYQNSASQVFCAEILNYLSRRSNF